MTRSPRPLALLVLAVALAACDTAEPAPTAEVTVGATYAVGGDAGADYGGSVLAFRDAATGEATYNFLEAGAEILVTFVDERQFEAFLFVPYEALVASGETDDLDGDVRQEFAGTYTQSNGALTLTPDEFVDTFFTDEGWTIDADGGAIRYQDEEDGLVIDVVLTRG